MHRIIIIALLIVSVAVAAPAFYFTKDSWYPILLSQSKPVEAEDAHEEHGSADHIELSEQARNTIGIQLKPVKLVSEPYEKKIRVPASIVPVPGKSLVGVTTYITGVITKIHVRQGQSVFPGAPLFSVHLHSHDVQDTQSQLYKVVQNLAINAKERQRLEDVARMGALAETKLLEVKYQHQRLETEEHSLRSSLKIHGFTKKEIDDIARGEFVKDRVIFAPMDDKEFQPHNGTTVVDMSQSTDPGPVIYEVKKILVKPGDQVNPGQTLGVLSNHQTLFIEAHAFPSETDLIENSIKEKTPVYAEILDQPGEQSTWIKEPLRILYMDHDVDDDNQTLSFYVPIQNISQSYTRDGVPYRVWKYRSGQKVFLHIPVAEYKNVFVLPKDAVVTDGAESYVFRSNGKQLVLKPIQIVYQDRHNVVIANDGSIFEGNEIAHHGAAQIYRALKTKSDDGAGHHHHHH